jgi:thymidylate kinase
VIFDRYMYDQLAALPLSNWLARSFARLVLAFTPNTDVSYLLDANPEEARARKPEYPLEFMRQYRNSYLTLRQLAPLSLISPAQPDDVHAAIVTRLQKVLSNTSQARVDSTVAA